MHKSPNFFLKMKNMYHFLILLQNLNFQKITQVTPFPSPAHISLFNLLLSYKKAVWRDIVMQCMRAVSPCSMLNLVKIHNEPYTYKQSSQCQTTSQSTGFLRTHQIHHTCRIVQLVLRCHMHMHMVKGRQDMQNISYKIKLYIVHFTGCQK